MKADVASHNILLKSCCLASKVDLAHDIYKMMRMLESEGVLKLDVFTYSSMIKVIVMFDFLLLSTRLCTGEYTLVFVTTVYGYVIPLMELKVSILVL